MVDPLNLPQPRPLPIALAPGMTVVSLDNHPTGEILGITQAYCIYSLGGSVCVDRWVDLALARVCPATPLLPKTVNENDRLNAGACILRELSWLKSLGDLTPNQTATLGELMETLCPSTRTDLAH
jgi:hypothetical protein